MNENTFLSPLKFILLVIVEQYSLHYDWGPTALCGIVDILADYLFESRWDLGIDKLCQKLDGIHLQSEGCTLRESLALRMQNLKTTDSFHRFFDELGCLVIDIESQNAVNQDATLFDSESIFGVFVRRCLLSFNRLEFHRIGPFHTQCMAAMDAIADRNALFSPTDSECTMSQDELAEYVEVQIGILEEESRVPMPKEMEKIIKLIMKRIPDNARLHYLNYLNLARSGEHEQSEASLRQFFDTNAIQDDRTTYQYALLNLAVARTRLGFIGEAERALTEAMHIARDCQDHMCLLYILGWDIKLKYMKVQAGMAVQKDVWHAMQTLVEKSARVHNHQMHATGLVQMAEFLLGVGASPDQVFRPLVQASSLIYEFDNASLCNAWHLTMSRVWATYQSPWMSLLHVSLSQQTGKVKDRRMLTEQQETEALCLQAQAMAQNGAPRHALRVIQSRLGKGFVSYGNMNTVQDMQDILCIAYFPALCARKGSTTGNIAKLQRAQQLVVRGYYDQAIDILNSLACATTATSTLTDIQMAIVVNDMLGKLEKVGYQR